MTEAPAAAVTAYIGIGSNLGGPTRQLSIALNELEAIDSIRILDVSSLYRSGPLGGIEQPDFLNAAVAVRASLDAAALLAELKGIEERMGRDRSVRRWGPRAIDLDLLLYGDVTIESSELTVPHAGIGERNFVLLPLRDLAPELVIPGLGPIKDQPVPDEPRIERISDAPWR